jgi:YD repeat-containing protein
MNAPEWPEIRPDDSYRSPPAPSQTGGQTLLPLLAIALGVTLLLVLILIPLHPKFSSHPTPIAAQPLHQPQTSPTPITAPLARIEELHGTGRIYLVQLGPHTLPYQLDNLAQWLRATYALDVQVLPAIALDHAAWDTTRNQYIGELLNDQIKRDLPILAADPNAYLIGFTDADMYSISEKWDASFTQRDHHRVAIISAHDLDYSSQLLQSSLHRILLRDVALLYWQLPINNDPNSVLAPIMDLWEPGEVLYESELHPERTQHGRYINDPCVVFVYTPAQGAKPAALNPRSSDPISDCRTEDGPAHDTGQELFQLSLRNGLLTVRHTDFYLPGTIPIQFERATVDWLKTPMAFGASGSHNYDQYIGSWDGMRHIRIIDTAGKDDTLVRIPEWLPILLFNKWVDQEGSGNMETLHWRPGSDEHFDLNRYTGDVESYLPCDDKAICYLNGFHNAHGDALVFTRNADRGLTRLTSPSHDWIALAYDEAKRIRQIDDSSGRQVRYHYDSGGRLTSVLYPSGETLSYTYDTNQNLLTFGAAPNPATPPTILLRNDYADGRIARQTLADGRTFQYRFVPVTDPQLSALVTVVTPDGTTLDLATRDRSGTTILERSSPLTK